MTASSKVARVVFLVDCEDWAYGSIARSVIDELRHDYDFRLYFLDKDRPDLRRLDPDIVYVSYWGETYHQRFLLPPKNIVREVASLRWLEGSPGPMQPIDFAARYLNDAGSIVAPSLEICRLFRSNGIEVHHCPNGIDTKLFHGRPAPSGPLKVGWVGNPKDPQKGFEELVLPAVEGFSFRYSSGSWSQRQVADFYGDIDVLVIASSSEGQPLPLIEGMASGVFPVATRVGIVPELVRNGENGLIVDRSIGDIRDALEWCQDNLDKIRSRRELISSEIVETRDWHVVAPHFDRIFRSVLAMDETAPSSIRASGARPESTSTATENPSRAGDPETAVFDAYRNHLVGIQGLADEGAFARAKPRLYEDVMRHLPNDRGAEILEIGPGQGFLLKYLIELGYEKIDIVDRSSSLVSEVQRRFGENLRSIQCLDAVEYLRSQTASYNAIVAVDVIEHLPPEEILEFVAAAHTALKVGGKLVLRTPNMANVFGSYSRYIDLTHRIGFTESSLEHLLISGGFPRVEIRGAARFGSWFGLLVVRMVEKLQRELMRLQGRTVPHLLGVNLIGVAYR